MTHDCIQADRIVKLEDKALKACEFKGGVDVELVNIKGSLKNLHIKMDSLLFTVIGAIFVTILAMGISKIYENAHAGEGNPRHYNAETRP